MASSGYWGLLLLMAAENLFPPLPSELIVPLAGYMAGREQLSLVAVIFVGSIGSVLGTLPLYFLGRRLGEKRVRDMARRHGRWMTISPCDVKRADDWLNRHGSWALVLCRLVPGVRSLIALPAGVARISLFMFIACTTLGAAAWTALLAVSGYLLGSRFRTVETYLDPVSWIVFGLLVAAYVVRVVRAGRRAEANAEMPRARLDRAELS